ncbi:MAG: NTP transferase domain-containing protein [Caulobacteraceae bacterium]
MSGFRALVLAGARGGVDPVAAYAGVSHKGLAEVDGAPLVLRVLKALAEAGATTIAISTANAELTAAALAEPGLPPVEILPAEATPSMSVSAAMERLGAPLLVTTVDHALLQPDWITRFLADTPADADIAILLAGESAVQAAAPGTRRTYLQFRDGRYSGCNLFYLATDRARLGVELWRQVETHRKRPWRIAMMLGPATLVQFLLRRLTLAQAVARLGRRVGVTAAAVRTPFGLAAVDVDKPSDLDLVRAIAERI